MKKLSFFLMAMLFSVMSFAAEETATLSFANKEQRTLQNTNQQVWTQNGITLTNDKASSTSAVADYVNPARFYKSSKITVKCDLGTITKIVFDCNSTSYATALKSSITSGTVTVSSDKVTVVPATESDTYVINSLTGGQVRMDALTVTYVAEEEDPNTPVYTITATSADATMGSITGAGEYKQGKEVSLTAVANPGYEFVKWSNESTENPLVFEATENVTLTATFQAQTPITIAEANQLKDNATGILKEFVVTYVYKSYIHIQDETGYAMAYKYDYGLKAGDKVTGFTFSKTTYNGLAQLVPTTTKLADLGIVSGEAPAVPEVTTAPTGNYQTVVKLMNVKMTGSFTTSSNTTLVATCPDETTINVYNNKNLTYTFADGKTYNIVGGITQFSNKIQVLAYAIEEYVAPTMYNVTVTAENGTVEGAGEYIENAEVTLTATPAEGYEFVNWTSGETEVSTANPFTFTVTSDTTLVANFKAVEPTTITYELNGGELPKVKVPTNAELWGTDTADVNGLMHYFNHYHNLKRSAQDISADVSTNPVATFLTGMPDEAGVFVDEESKYKWLGDYIIKVTNDQIAEGKLSVLKAVDSNIKWRYGVQAFFMCLPATDSNYKGWADFTEAGKPEAWGAAYQAANELVLPTEPVDAPYTLPTPVKEGYKFVGWYDNAEGKDEPYTVIPAGWSGTLYAIWEADGPTTALDNLNTTVAPVKTIINGQLIIINNGVQYNALGQVIR